MAPKPAARKGDPLVSGLEEEASKKLRWGLELGPKGRKGNHVLLEWR